MNAYADLPVREQIEADRLDTPFRCDANHEHVATSVAWHELPGGARFRFCPACAAKHRAIPVEVMA